MLPNPSTGKPLAKARPLSAQSFRVLALDPGFERLGVAVVERVAAGKETLLYSACLRTSADNSFPDRLFELGAQVEALVEAYAPQAMSLEEIYFAKNEKTAMKIAEVRGMLTYIAKSHRLALYQYTPLQVKVAITGYGKSDKRAVAVMVPRLLALPIKKRLDDEIDAIAIGLTCLATQHFSH